ncbi:MAG: hypothetical protein ACQEUZ_06395 [Pseudomonadota bacterium]
MSEMERLAERLREYANLLNDKDGDMAPRNPLKSKLRAEERDLRDAATTLRALRERVEKAEADAERNAAIATAAISKARNLRAWLENAEEELRARGAIGAADMIRSAALGPGAAGNG